GQLFDAVAGEREDFAQVRVPDQRDVPELVVDGQAFARLLGGEDVLELFQADGRAVAELDVDVLELDLVGQAAQPRHVGLGQHLRVQIERLAGRLVVVRVVHASGDRGVVAGGGRGFGQAAHDVGALVGRPAVAHGVAQTVIVVDDLGPEGFQDGTQRFVVGVDVAQDAQAHGWT